MQTPVWCPPGYVPVSQIGQFAGERLDSGERLTRFPVPTPETMQDWLRGFVRDLEHALAWDELPAIGIDLVTGTLHTIPANSWRINASQPMEFRKVWPARESQFAAAIQGRPILVQPLFGPEVNTAVATSTLAEWLGTSNVPDAPRIVPERQSPPAAELSDTKMAALREWMEGYARAHVTLRNSVVKREDAIKELVKAKRCTTREAEDAYEALPHPELRNPPRTPR